MARIHKHSPRSRSRGSFFAFVVPALLVGVGLVGGCELITQINPSDISGAGGASSSSSHASSTGGMSSTSHSASTTSSSSGMFDGGSVSSSTTSSSSGVTMDAGCTVVSDCPTPTDTCQLAVCQGGLCGVSNVPANQPSPTQMTGTCLEVLCDGDGGTISIPDAGNVGTSPNPCIAEGCDAGTIVYSDLTGTACTVNGGNVCSDAGDCVQCNVDSDCVGSMAGYCQLNKCVSGQCSDHVQDGNETDVDCGGSCQPCGPTYKCKVNADCTSVDCQNGICQPPSCTDGIQNNNETGIDCGGPNCAPVGKLCAPGVSCKANSDCQSFRCEGLVCTAPSCTDKTLNGTETDTDCGGGACPACPVGDTCQQGSDCQQKVCNVGDAGILTCAAPTCTDGQQNGTETDTDCGGGSCPACKAGRMCLVKTDCDSLDCIGGLCLMSTCVDGIQNEGETGIDCGGPCGATCKPGVGCDGDGDCVSGYCTTVGGQMLCELRPNGMACTLTSQCTTGFCVGPSGSQVCCDQACTSNCQACIAARTGAPADGTCGFVTAGQTAPAGQCLANGSCGNDGKCTTNGACEQIAAATPCGAQTCTSSMYTPIGACDGKGACDQTTAPCAGGFICASGTICKTSCGPDTDCTSSSAFCSGGMCVSRGAPGAACTKNDDACVSMLCGPTGAGSHCCTTGCTTGSSCGATDCDTSGACIYPPTSQSCGVTACVNGVFTALGTCSGSGTCNSGITSPCAGGLGCASGTACKLVCQNDSDCASSSSYCTGPGGMCLPREAAGGTCTTADECTSGICGATGTTGPSQHCCAAACGGSGVCGATDCDATGACSYAPTTTACGAATCSAGMFTLASSGTCNGAGTCTTATPQACAGGVICQDATSCKPSCMGDADCLSPSDYCTSTGVCALREAVGGACTEDDECTSGLCGPLGKGDHCCKTTCGGSGACVATDCDPTTGACLYAPPTTACGTATCSAGMYTAASSGTCDGSGSCNAATPKACPGGVICQDATTCKPSCTADSDCLSASDYCMNPGASGTCVAREAGGQPCTIADDCTSGNCNAGVVVAADAGTSNCCSSTCVTTGVCGAEGCDGTGACVYPGSTVACGTPGCTDNPTTKTSASTTVGTCASGSCSQPPTSCGVYKCQGSACGTSCTSNTECWSGNCVLSGGNGDAGTGDAGSGGDAGTATGTCM